MIQQFSDLGFENHEDYNSSKTEIEEKAICMMVLLFAVGLKSINLS